VGYYSEEFYPLGFNASSVDHKNDTNINPKYCLHQLTSGTVMHAFFFPDRKLNLFSTFKQNPYGLTWCTKHVFVVQVSL